MRITSLDSCQDQPSQAGTAPSSLRYVWNETEQELSSVDQLIPRGSSDAQALRRQLAEAYQAHKRDPLNSTALWRCPICWEPLLLAGRPTGGGFYVRHRQNPTYACPLKNGASLSLSEWNALRFNGQKESARHIQLKHQIREMLEAWPGSDSVMVEPTVRGRDKLDWKRPDILASIDGQQVAIEIQLSSTYLDVIVSREMFYRENDTIVLWVFDRFTHEGHRLYEKDIYYQHNGNAFEVTDEALAAATATGTPHLTCHYLEPQLTGEAIASTWKRAVVPLPEITFCPTTYRTYWFDCGAKLAALKDQLSRRPQIDQLIAVIAQDRDAGARRAEIRSLLADIYQDADSGSQVPEVDTGAIRMMEVIVSAQRGQFAGELGATRNSNWPFWANTMFEHYGEFAKAFMRVTHHYELAAHFTNRASWKKKKSAIAEKRTRGEQRERTEWWPVFALIAPECDWTL